MARFSGRAIVNDLEVPLLGAAWLEYASVRVESMLPHTSSGKPLGMISLRDFQLTHLALMGATC